MTEASGNSLQILLEAADKQQRVVELRRLLGEVLEQLAAMEEREKPYLLATFQKLLGEKELDLLIAQVENRQMRRRVELAMMAINCGQAPDNQQIEWRIEQEFLEWRQKIERRKEEYLNGIGWLTQMSGQLSPQEGEQLKRLYRDLCKRLHPDVVGHDSPIYQRYWPQVQTAYRNGDVSMMELLLSVVSGESGEEMPVELPLLDGEIERLNVQLADAMQRVSLLRSQPPFVYAATLRDDAWIAARRSQLDANIAQLKADSARLRVWLESLPQVQTPPRSH